MTYNVKTAVKAAFAILTFVTLAGCEEPTKANSGQQAASASSCNCNTSKLRQAQESENYVAAPSRRRVVAHAATRRIVARAVSRAPGRVASRASYSSSSSSSESEYYSSSYVSQSSVSGSSSSYGSSVYGSGTYGYGASGGVTAARTGATGWIDGFGKHYAVGRTYGAGYPVYHDGGSGAAYLDVQTDDRYMADPWHGYNFRQGLSNGY